MDKQKILIIAAVVIVILIFIGAFGLKKGRGPSSVTLEFWSVYDDSSVYSELIEAYQKEHKNITIKYEEKTFADYEKDLINALAANKGPDIFSIHNTWLPRYKDKIKEMPQSEEFINLRTFQNTFADVAYKDFVDNDKIYAVPFYIDTLALYYNKELFNSAGIPLPPADWKEFLDDVELLTEKDQSNNIEKSGASIGTAKNINRSTDILSLLMLQTGAEMTDKDHTRATFDQSVYLEKESFSPGKDALRFYTDFSNPTKRIYCWNRQMPYSIDAFYQGKTAMMINYSHHLKTIRAKAPYLNFAVSSVPQIKDRDFSINYANYWGQTVSKNSTHSEEAWKFILYIVQKENLKKYLESAERPTSRRDLIEWQRNNSDLTVFTNQVLSARSWYQADSQGIERILADMVESVVLGSDSIDQAITKAVDQVNVLMRK